MITQYLGFACKCFSLVLTQFSVFIQLECSFLIHLLVILCVFHNSHVHPLQFRIPSYLPSALSPSPREKRKQEKILMVEAVLWHSESHRAQVSPYIFTCREPVVWFEVSGFCYTVDAGPHCDSSWMCCCCPMSWRSCNFGFAGLAASSPPQVALACAASVAGLWLPVKQEQEQGPQVHPNHGGLDPCPQRIWHQCEEAALLHLSHLTQMYLSFPLSPQQPVFIINFIVTGKE